MWRGIECEVEMLEIAGGILIAVMVLVFLPFILEAAYWAIAIGIGLAIVIGIWLALAAFVGGGWAVAIMMSAVMLWLGWNDMREARERETESSGDKTDNAFERIGN